LSDEAFKRSKMRQFIVRGGPGADDEDTTLEHRRSVHDWDAFRSGLERAAEEARCRVASAVEAYREPSPESPEAVLREPLTSMLGWHRDDWVRREAQRRMLLGTPVEWATRMAEQDWRRLKDEDERRRFWTRTCTTFTRLANQMQTRAAFKDGVLDLLRNRETVGQYEGVTSAAIRDLREQVGLKDGSKRIVATVMEEAGLRLFRLGGAGSPMMQRRAWVTTVAGFVPKVKLTPRNPNWRLR
jgi:hypothetical protein